METRRRSSRIAKLVEGVEEKVEEPKVEKKNAPKRARGKKIEEIPEKKTRFEDLEDPSIEVDVPKNVKAPKNPENHNSDNFAKPTLPLSNRPRRSITSRRVSYTPDPTDSMIQMSSSSSSEIDSDSDENEFSFSVKQENERANSRNSGRNEKQNLKRKPVKTSSSESDSDSGSGTGSDSESEDRDEDEEKPGPSNGRSKEGKRGHFGGRGRVVRKKPTGKEVDQGDVNWPKCRKASIARKTGNPTNSKNASTKSGLRMAARPKPQQPWKKNLAAYEKDRKLAKGERRMKEYRLIAKAYAKGKIEEVSYDECFKIHEDMKKAYHEGKKLIEAIQKEERIRENPEDQNGESSSEDEWEEMEQFEPVIDDLIEVNLENEGEEGVLKDWWVIYLRQEVNKQIRRMWENTHKMHLLCYMAHLNFVVRTSLDEDLVPSLMVSQLPSGYLDYIGSSIPNDVLQKLVKWYSSAFRPMHGQLSVTAIDEGLKIGQEARYPETSRLSTLVNHKVFETDLDRAVLLFALFVGMEQTARICVNAQVISRKWDKEQQEQLKKDMEVFKERSKSPPAKNDEEPEISEENKEKSKKGSKSKVVKKPKEFRNYWVELWNKTERRWICIDPLNSIFDEPLKIHESANLPITYVLAVDNKRGICEISQRYAMDCVKQEFRRRRTDPGWLRWTLNLPIFAANIERKKFERMQMQEELVKRPLPTTMSEYKNHPLYVLEKDLLKFEAIYPPTKEQKPLGEIRGHKVYPRSTVFTLQGENNWLKLARSVKIGEKPYKMVKARPDPRIPAEERVEKFLEVYGYWQTEPYRRPVVKKGKIPRNEYGNVYMFAESMCPIGCTYLKLPGLVQISRKLNKECVQAVVGWAFDGGWTHPVMDGAVVLDADAELFRKEWQKIEDSRAEKDEQKRKERVMENWKKMIKGMLRLKYVRNEFGVEKKSKKANQKCAENGTENVEKEEDIIDNSNTRKPIDGFSLDDFIKPRK